MTRRVPRHFGCQVPVDACRFGFGCCLTLSAALDFGVADRSGSRSLDGAGVFAGVPDVDQRVGHAAVDDRMRVLPADVRGAALDPDDAAFGDESLDSLPINDRHRRRRAPFRGRCKFWGGRCPSGEPIVRGGHVERLVGPDRVVLVDPGVELRLRIREVGNVRPVRNSTPASSASDTTASIKPAKSPCATPENSAISPSDGPTKDNKS